MKKLKYFLLVLGIFGLVALYANELIHFSNTFGSDKLVVGALVVGVLVGVGVAFSWARGEADEVAKMQMWATSVICCTILMPLFASLTNRFFAQPIENKIFTFIKRIPYRASRFGTTTPLSTSVVMADGYFFYILDEKKQAQRLKAKHPMFEEIGEGANIQLPIRHGLLGFDFYVELD